VGLNTIDETNHHPPPVSLKLFSNLPEQIVMHLRLRILSGQLAPGTPLREETLAQEFGVSRGPVRDALLTLTKEGMLHGRPNAGVRVAEEPSAFKREVIVRVRREIEGSALGVWFDRPEPQLLVQLDANLAEYKVVCAADEFSRVVDLDVTFHRLLVESVENGALVALWLPVMSQMFLRYSRHRKLLESYHEHLAIVAAMKAGDRSKAIELLSLHIV